MRSVRITADDFGLDRQVNAAITLLAATGHLDAASVLIDAPCAADALSRRLPIAVGLHLAVNPEMLATGTGVQIRTELDRQWQQMSTAHPPAHLDLHTTALYGLGPGARPGGILPEALALAAAHRVPLRLPRILPPGLPDEARGHRDLVQQAERAGVPLPQTVISDLRPAHQIPSYADLRAHYRDLILALPAGHSEVFLHPARPPRPAPGDHSGQVQGDHSGQVPTGTDDGPQAEHRVVPQPGIRTDPERRKRWWEYRLLASGDLHRLLADAGVRTGRGAVPDG